jgi:uncharacterized protein
MTASEKLAERGGTMTVIERHDEGTFCWIEIAARDQAGLDFYPRLFVWEAETQPIPGGSYTWFSLGGRPVAGGFLLGEQQIADGMPAHWNLYVAVADVDGAAERAKGLGGTLVVGPLDIPQTGRTAAVKDPTGAMICLWQATGHIGFRVRDEPGTFSWPELLTPDTDGAVAFYGGLFGWNAGESMGTAEGGTYTIFRLGGRGVGGLAPLPADDVGPQWLPYLEVADCDAAVASAVDLGGHVHHEGTTVDGVGRLAALGDPGDAGFCVIRSEPPS